jgi:hypothetical protein
MSQIIFCDTCGVELGKGKGVYRVEVGLSGEPYNTRRYELCLKCAKPLIEWRTIHPKRKMVVQESE